MRERKRERETGRKRGRRRDFGKWQTILSGKYAKNYIDNKVKTDVPENAKFTDTTYSNATTSVSGLMSNTDKSKLDGVEAGANKYVHPTGTNPHGTTKSDVGLGNVDNIQQASKAEFDTHNSDSIRHITSSERTTWNAKGSSNLGLGETSATAYRGDRGKIAYDHSQTAHAPTNAQKNSDITKAEIEAKLTGDISSHTHNQYIESSKFQVVTSLPASPVEGVFYFVKE